MTPQLVDVHQSAIVDIAGNALKDDGSPVVLTNLDFTPDSSAVGEQESDFDPTDDNNVLVASDVIGATADLTFTADGDDGKKYEALATVTIVAKDVPVAAMQLTFTERV